MFSPTRSQKSENDKTMKLEEHSIDELISRMQTVLEVCPTLYTKNLGSRSTRNVTQVTKLKVRFTESPQN